MNSFIIYALYHEDSQHTRPISEETRAKHRARMLGHKMSSESIARMAATKRGKKANPEGVEKRSAQMRGRKQSPEAVANRLSAVRLALARRTLIRLLHCRETGEYEQELRRSRWRQKFYSGQKHNETMIGESV